MNPQPKPWRVKLKPLALLILRRSVAKMDGWCCRVCGRSWDLQAHHMIPRSKARLDVAGNMVTLCKDCHADVTERRIQLRWACPVVVNGVELAGEGREIEVTR